MGRPRQFEPEEAVEAAMQTFWSQGYEATSLHDLLASTSLSRSSFYQTFESKRRLFGRCLARYGETVLGDLEAARIETVSPRAFLEALLRGVADETGGGMERRGCLFVNTANEFGQADDSVARDLGRQMRRMEAIFRTAVEAAQDDGTVSTRSAPEALTRYLINNLCGLKTLVKMGASRDDILEVAEITLAALD